jgi:hypothetical protein
MIKSKFDIWFENSYPLEYRMTDPGLRPMLREVWVKSLDSALEYGDATETHSNIVWELRALCIEVERKSTQK